MRATDGVEGDSHARSTRQSPSTSATRSRSRSTEGPSDVKAEDNADLDQPDEDAKSTASMSRTARGGSPAPAIEALVSLQNAAGLKNQNAQFVHKLFAMVETPFLQSLICWADNGLSFSVFNPTEFSRTVLPQFFKHNNFQSFVRQLNMYGFHKVNDMVGNILPGSDGVIAWEFQHPSFQRDKPELLSRIKRKSSKPSASVNGFTGSSRKATQSAPVQKLAPKAHSPKDDTPTLEETNSDSEPPTPAPAAVASDVVPEYTYPERHMPRRASGSFNLGKSERDSPQRRSPPSIPAVTTYPASNANLSPRSYSVSSHPYPSSYAGPPPGSSSSSEATITAALRQIATLEGQLRGLSDALYYSQQENQATRMAMASSMSAMLSAIHSLDVNNDRKEELERVHATLLRIAGESSSLASGPGSGTPFAFSPFGASTPWPPPPPQLLRSPRPVTSTSGPFFYQRPGPAESFARGAGPPSRGDSRDESATTYGAPPPTAPASSSGPLNLPSYSSAPSAAYSLRPASASSQYGPNLGRPSSSGILSGTTPQSYPTPRTSWHSSSGSSVPPRTAESITTLPPISALFGHSDSLRRIGLDGDDLEESARKKARR